MTRPLLLIALLFLVLIAIPISAAAARDPAGWYSPALAAWVQAIGAILAVGAAILAGQHQAAAAREVAAAEGRRERERECRAAAGLLRLAVRYGEESLVLMDHASSLTRDFASPEGFEAIRAGLEVLPVHALEDADAALNIVSLRAAIARFHSRHRTLQRGRREEMTQHRQRQLRNRMAADRAEAQTTLEALRAAIAAAEAQAAGLMTRTT